jgi:hypothetical protein
MDASTLKSNGASVTQLLKRPFNQPLPCLVAEELARQHVFDDTIMWVKLYGNAKVVVIAGE